jgi:hypothetical protein
VALYSPKPKVNVFKTKKRETKWHLPVDYRELTQAERRSVRNQYRQEQDNLCTHCQQMLNGPPSNKVRRAEINMALFPPGFFDYPVHLHHDHLTGDTIGAVHAACNAYLWQYKGE